MKSIRFATYDCLFIPQLIATCQKF